MSTKGSKKPAPKPPLRIVLYGPQGSGKGTQAEVLARQYHLPIITAGNILRSAMHKNTPFGRSIKRILDRGGLLPNPMTNKLMQPALKKFSRIGFILDGFPRTMPQLRFVEKIAPPTVVVLLHLSDAEAVRRLSNRRVCAREHVYHLLYKPPRRAGICDIDGLPLVQRHDDTPVAIRERLKLFHEQTGQVLKYFRTRGTLVTVDGRPSIPKVSQALQKALKVFLAQ